MKRLGLCLVASCWFGWCAGLVSAAAPACYQRRDTWADTLLATRQAVLAGARPSSPLWAQFERDFPLESDWLMQDLQGLGVGCDWANDELATYPARWFTARVPADLNEKLIARVVAELGPQGQPLASELARLRREAVAAASRPWLELYLKACQARRDQRLSAMASQCRALVFTKHYNMGGSHYAYTEGQSDAQAERHFVPGSALCLLEMDGPRPRIRTLLEDPQGVIRDPDVSYDGRRVLFAWKKSLELDDYHLYEMELATGRVRQLTFGLGFADYEGAYLADDQIVFNSTRCVQTVDCYTTEVSNLYACDADGGRIRRLGFDQVHTNFPTLTPDGRLLYTRWEYSDRGQIYPQALFQMNPDGTCQSEFYGNNSFFPTTILHARGVPGTQKVLAIATGHHSRQVGKLVLIDPSKGRQENEGVQLIAPVRDTPAVKIDAFGQDGELFQYPYPLTETEYLVAYAAQGWGDARKRPTDTGGLGRRPLFGVYYMTLDGRRELLAADPQVSCNQPVPLVRPMPRGRPSLVDYHKATGAYYLQDVYAGPGLAGIPRGTVKRLRVVAIDFRAALIGGNGNSGPAGGAFVSTPPAVGNGCWDPKIVLGEADVHDDGSAFFTVPARTPVYFQAVDAQGHVVQTMRSWSTVQPGERGSCVGCHESKNSAPPPYRLSAALRGRPQALRPFYGPARGFSFPKEIQPILDRHCTRCHTDRSQLAWLGGSTNAAKPGAKQSTTAFSLLSEENVDPSAKRRFSDAYLVLTGAKVEWRNKKTLAFRGDPSRELVNWISPQSAPPMLPPYSAGAARSRLLRLLEEGHQGVRLGREELDKIACWIDLLVPYCGDYREANAWTDAERERYDYFLAKRARMDAAELANVALLAESRRAGAEQSQPLTIEVVDAADKTVVKKQEPATADQPLAIELARPFQPGDRVRISGANHLAVQIGQGLGTALVFAHGERFEYAIPAAPGAPKGMLATYPPGAFAAPRPTITARPVRLAELDGYRNLARNPYDLGPATALFPHASTNSECRHEAVFGGRNAIDGFARNERHGAWPYQSWGPDKRKDLWWQVDFGRPVSIDRVTIVLRADFPHDKHWRRATIELSDGTRRTITLEKTGAAQTFPIPPREVQWVRLANLECEEPLGWCALAEVEVWGRDVSPAVGDDLSRLPPVAQASKP
jgi:hypothetical protein